MTKKALKENDDRKAELISTVQEYWKEALPMVSADAACPWSLEELEAMTIEELEGAVEEAREAYQNSGDPHGDFSDDDYLADDEENPRYYTDLDDAEFEKASMRIAAREPYDPAEDLPSKSGMGRRVEGLSKSVLNIIIAEGAALKAAGLIDKCELNYDAIQEAVYDEMLRGEINEVEGTKEELQSLIAAMDPNEVATDEYFDSETGEIYLAAGQKAGSSWMHPSYQKVQPKKRGWVYMDDEPDWSDVEPEGNVQNQYQTAIEMYAADFSGESYDDPEGAAQDAAEGFFPLHPEWTMWSKALGISRAGMKGQIADLIHSSILGESLQLEGPEEGPWVCMGCGDVKSDHPEGARCRRCDMEYTAKDDLSPEEKREMFSEAKYKGREVPLGKPMKGDTAKFKVYVKDKKTGNVKKVNFGSKGMEIRRDNPKARKSFRARHGCGTARSSDRTKAAYWSCRMWSTKPVSKIVGGK